MDISEEQNHIEDRYAWRKEYIMTVIPFLKSVPMFQGGELCQWCRDKGLRDPHHHNEWVSMPQILQKNQLIEPIGVCHPKTAHSHINELTLWKSIAYAPGSEIQKDLFYGDPE